MRGVWMFMLALSASFLGANTYVANGSTDTTPDNLSNPTEFSGPTNMETINIEIDQLQNELNEVRKKTNTDQGNAQSPSMNGQWQEFVEGSQAAEEEEKEVENIKQEMQHLEVQKQNLQNSPSQNQNK